MKVRFNPLRKVPALPLILAAAAVTSGPTLVANDAEIATLRAQIAQLQEAINRLETKQEKQEEVQAQQPVIKVGTRGLTIDSPDGTYRFKVGGLVQLDSRFYLNQNSTGSSTFDLRRVRPTLQGNIGKNLGFRFTPELASNVRILDAYGDFTFIENNVLRFGNFKAPVGLERLQGGANLRFNERGFPTEFTPGRDLGFQIQSQFFSKALTTKIGVFNGAVDGSNGAPSLGSGGFTASGSVFVEPFKTDTESAFRGLGVGFAASFGRREGNAGFRVRAPNRLDVAVNNNMLEDGVTYRLNPSLYYYYGPFGLLTEYILSSRELYVAGGTLSRYDNDGWTVQASYVLTGEDNSYGSITPKDPVKGFGQGGIGAWEVAARYTGVSLDGDLFRNGLLNAAQAKSANSYGIGINWYLTPNLAALLSYDYTAYRGGAAGFNRSNDNTILTRFQVSF